MTTPEATMPPPPILGSAQPHTFSPTQPDPVGWRTNTTSHTRSYMRETHSALQTDAAAPDALAQFRHHVRQALLDAVIDHYVDVHTTNTLLQTLDLPLLPHRWQVRLVLPLLIEVTATTRAGAFEAAEAAFDAALTNAELAVHIEWDRCERDGADPGSFDPTPSANYATGQRLAP